MRNSKVHCLISVCSCFVIILKFIFFSTVTNSEVDKCGYDMEGGCFTDVMLRSLTN